MYDHKNTHMHSLFLHHSLIPHHCTGEDNIIIPILSSKLLYHAYCHIKVTLLLIVFGKAKEIFRVKWYVSWHEIEYMVLYILQN